MNNITTLITGNKTEVTFNTINGNTIQTSLVPETFLSTQDTESGKAQAFFTIYPNPAKENVYIVLKKNTVENIKILDRAGNDMSSKMTVKEKQGSLELNLRSVEKGVYIVCIDGQCKKIIKE